MSTCSLCNSDVALYFFKVLKCIIYHGILFRGTTIEQLNYLNLHIKNLYINLCIKRTLNRDQNTYEFI